MKNISKILVIGLSAFITGFILATAQYYGNNPGYSIQEPVQFTMPAISKAKQKYVDIADNPYIPAINEACTYTTSEDGVTYAQCGK